MSDEVLQQNLVCKDHAATLDDVREAVAMHEETARIARRVLGGAHPVEEEIRGDLETSRALLSNRVTLAGISRSP
jgi:hypothetical protein